MPVFELDGDFEVKTSSVASWTDNETGEVKEAAKCTLVHKGLFVHAFGYVAAKIQERLAEGEGLRLACELRATEQGMKIDAIKVLYG